MSILLRKFKVASIFVALFLVLAFATGASAAAYKDAILYRVTTAGVLEFNVTHTANVSETVVIADQTGSGIATLDDLKAVMGVVDTPSPVFSPLFGVDPKLRTLGKAVSANLEIVENEVVSMTIVSVRERPLIGITKRTFTSNTPGATNEVFWAGAFERNGAFCVYLNTVTNAEEAAGYVSKLNGIFVCGGEDWHPALYNETVTPHGSSGWNVGRDISDFYLMQQAIALDVPMLAACRGHQGFNIVMGGGLIQDIPFYLTQEVLAGRIDASRVSGYTAVTTTHRAYKYEDIIDVDGNLIPYSGTGSAPYTTVNCDATCRQRVQVDGVIHSGGTSYHRIEAGENIGVLPNSKWLYDIVGDRGIPAVATAHHQAVNPEKLGMGITIVAVASDGIVEAIEHQSSLFALGVQFHPERDAGGGTSGIRSGYIDPDSSNAFLRALVKYAAIHADDTYVEAEAFVTKLNGNKNELTITVLEFYSNGDIKNEYKKVFTIDNNAAGTYGVGPCKVYVDTKGNTQIRDCRIVEWNK